MDVCVYEKQKLLYKEIFAQSLPSSASTPLFFRSKKMPRDVYNQLLLFVLITPEIYGIKGSPNKQDSD